MTIKEPQKIKENRKIAKVVDLLNDFQIIKLKGCDD